MEHSTLYETDAQLAVSAGTLPSPNLPSLVPFQGLKDEIEAGPANNDIGGTGTPRGFAPARDPAVGGIGGAGVQQGANPKTPGTSTSLKAENDIDTGSRFGSGISASVSGSSNGQSSVKGNGNPTSAPLAGYSGFPPSRGHPPLPEGSAPGSVGSASKDGNRHTEATSAGYSDGSRDANQNKARGKRIPLALALGVVGIVSALCVISSG